MPARWRRVLMGALIVLGGALGPVAVASAAPPTEPEPEPLFVDFRDERGKCVPDRPEVFPGPPTNRPLTYPPGLCSPLLFGNANQYPPRAMATFVFYRCTHSGTVTFELWRDGAGPDEQPIKSQVVTAFATGPAVWQTFVPTTPGAYVVRASCFELASYATFRFSVVRFGSSSPPPTLVGSGSGGSASGGSGSPLPGTGGEPWSLVRTGAVLLLAGGGTVVVSRYRRRPRPVAG